MNNQKKRVKSRITIGEIRLLIRDQFKSIVKEEWWAEAYDKALVDDPSLDDTSVLVPDDIKHNIKKWAQTMGLDGRKHSR